MGYSGKTRFQPDAAAGYEAFKAAAADYIANLAQGDRRGLREKPLDWNPGNPSYFSAMYQLLNALQAVGLPTESRIVEVGSGAGWATEIMAALRFKVDCVEPSSEMIDVAQRRLRDHLERHGVRGLYDNVSWQCATMEEAVLAEGAADAVLYFESFHHVIDEHAALERTWKALKPGGWLIILGDSNWIPGNDEQETAWTEETATYGTLESPFTDAYLVWLLKQRGFRDVARHHSVNALVPESRQNEPVRTFALMDATWVNLVLARKPAEGEAAAPDEAADVKAVAAALVEPPVLFELRTEVVPLPPPTTTDYGGPMRFKPDTAVDYAQFKATAVDYVSKLTMEHRRGLREKPLDWSPGHPGYLISMQQLLGALEAAELSVGCRIVEVGSGTGWVTEILASLAYGVDCVEPSADMLQVAAERVRSHLRHHGVEPLFDNISWRAATMEEVSLPAEAAEAVLYFESFHHVIDEHAALEQTWKALKPGGKIIILGDANWQPGNLAQEAVYADEMAAYGTLESPFTDAYLVWLLEKHGFVDIARHHLLRGLAPVARENEPVWALARMHAQDANLVIARKPTPGETAAAPEPPQASTPAQGQGPATTTPIQFGLRQRVVAKLRQLAALIEGRPA